MMDAGTREVSSRSNVHKKASIELHLLARHVKACEGVCGMSWCCWLGEAGAGCGGGIHKKVSIELYPLTLAHNDMRKLRPGCLVLPIVESWNGMQGVGWEY